MNYRKKIGLFLFLIIFSFSARVDAGQTICAAGFANSDGDAQVDWVGYFIADSIKNKLKILPGLDVISLKPGPGANAASAQVLCEAARAIGADAVVGGDYRKEGDAFAINVVFLEVKDNKQIGGASFSSSLADLHSRLNDLAVSLAGAVGLQYSDAQYARMQLLSTSSRDAMEYYGKALTHDPASREHFQLLQQALALDPSYTDALSAVGMHYCKIEKYAKAQEAFERLAQVQPEYPHVYFNLGYVLKSVMHYNKAIEMYRLAALKEPGDADAWNNIGVIHYLMGRYDEARQAFEHVLLIEPDRENARVNLERLAQKGPYGPAQRPLASTAKLKEYIELGAALYASGDYSGAVAAFQKALDLQPDNFKANNNLALAYLKMGEFDAAKKHFERALRADPTAVDVRENLAQLQKREPAAAPPAATAGVSSQQRDPRTLIAAGKVYLSRKSYGKAGESFIQALEMTPDDTDALHNLGLVYFAQGDYPNAQKQFERVLALDPQNEQARKRLEDIRFIAAPDARQPSLQIPMTPEMEAKAHFVRANELYQTGDYAHAAVEYSRALDFAPADVEILNNLGAAYYALGKQGEAETILKKAKELSPENETIARNLDSLSLLGDSEKDGEAGLIQITGKTEASSPPVFPGSAPLERAASEKVAQPEETPLPVAHQELRPLLPVSQDEQEEIVPTPKGIVRAQAAKEALQQVPSAQARESLKETSQSHFNKGVFKESEGDLEEALLHYREAIQLEPTNAAAQYNLGNIYFRLGAFESAIECYQAALQADAKSGKSYNNIGVAYYKLGRLEEAKQAWRKAVEVEPSLQSARENLSKYSGAGAK